MPTYELKFKIKTRRMQETVTTSNVGQGRKIRNSKFNITMFRYLNVRIHYKMRTEVNRF